MPSTVHRFGSAGPQTAGRRRRIRTGRGPREGSSGISRFRSISFSLLKFAPFVLIYRQFSRSEVKNYYLLFSKNFFAGLHLEKRLSIFRIKGRGIVGAGPAGHGR